MTNPDVTINLEALADIYHDATMCEIYRNRTDAEKKRADEADKLADETKAELQKAQALLDKANAVKPKPRELSPLFRQKVENASHVLSHMTPLVCSGNGEYPAADGARYNTVLKALRELHQVVLVEVIAS